MLSDLTKATLVQYDADEFYSADLCISLVRLESRLEVALNRVYKTVLECEIDLSWIRNIGFVDHAIATNDSLHICICCTRARNTILVSRVGTMCQVCFELLYALYSKCFIGNIAGVGQVLAFTNIVITARERITTYTIRRVFGCIWCLCDITKKYNRAIVGSGDSDVITNDSRGISDINTTSNIQRQECIICGITGHCGDVQCGATTYWYCYDCYTKSTMCIRRFVDKYLILCECVGADVGGLIVSQWLDHTKDIM